MNTLLRTTFSVGLLFLAGEAFTTPIAVPTLVAPNPVTPTLATNAPPAEALEIPSVEDVDILYLSDELKKWLDVTILPIKRREDRATALHERFFGANYRAIQYKSGTTKTAQETYSSREGNCLSLASLYVAAARYVGLNARFQTVQMPRDWESTDTFYIVPGHVNVTVDLSPDVMTVEFANVYDPRETKDFKSKKISDKQAQAEYYNNVSMETLEVGDLGRAIALLRKSINTYDKLDIAWSNLGVLYKMAGMLNDAEYAYKKALKIKSSNLSTINNLYILYRQQGNDKAAQKLAKKVERYSRKNPYYLYKIATSDVALKNYDSAISHLKSAIRKKEEEPKFHLLLSQTYFYAGKFDKSNKEMEKAIETSKNQQERDRYYHKLKAIERMQAGL